MAPVYQFEVRKTYEPSWWAPTVLFVVAWGLVFWTLDNRAAIICGGSPTGNLTIWLRYTLAFFALLRAAKLFQEWGGWRAGLTCRMAALVFLAFTLAHDWPPLPNKVWFALNCWY
ncbi:hypothetical protein CLV40_10992 [Actinokineospora auranticolor]|uniref:Uncharacterized protein n=2 Tax=Actinokineospora auranticolor TaxID=155976 RepID=A0A2S6GNB9_9PSEU|nr:hypothetical protein CLV40_10992 [Actinokineospora auranticolor]